MTTIFAAVFRAAEAEASPAAEAAFPAAARQEDFNLFRGHIPFSEYALFL